MMSNNLKIKWPKTFQKKIGKKKTALHQFTSLDQELKKIIIRKKSNENCTIPTKVFLFKLDDFQKIAIRCIQKKENVIVAAHTSSGKTLIGEYTISYFSLKKKVIYTCPIKALSNQKFRDLSRNFSNVGIITGDITLNSEAHCIIMTTEVIRSLLFRNLVSSNEIGSLILDEVHYIKDKERGFVWEEILMLLTREIHLLCLSATIPNIRELSEWIVDIKKKKIHIIQTLDRPIELRYYIFIEAFPRLILVTNQKGSLNEDKLKKIFSKCQKKRLSLFSRVNKTIKKIYSKKYEPIIVFAFNKEKCYQFAKSNLKSFLQNKNEIVLIKTLFNKIFEIVPNCYKNVSQLNLIINFFKKGTGIHHSGVLPFLKEITEILFQSNLIKILFATETFSVGLNMPAKTVIFSTLKKYDGQTIRILHKGEFVQMSGRAGRRGIDKRGIVVAIVDSDINVIMFRKLFKGITESIISMFRIRVSTFLAFCLNSKLILEKIVSKSFTFFQINLFLVFKKKVYIWFFKRNFLLINPRKLKFHVMLKAFYLGKALIFYVQKILTFTDFWSLIEEIKEFERKNTFPSHQILMPTLNKFSLKKFFNKKKLCFMGKFYQFKNSTKYFFFGSFLIFDFFEVGGIFSSNLQILSACFFRILICIKSLSLRVLLKSDKRLFFYLKLREIFFLRLSIKTLDQIRFQKACSVSPESKNLKKIFFKLKLLHENSDLTRKGKACWELNFEDGLIFTEMIFRKLFNDLPEYLTIVPVSFFFTNENQRNLPIHPHLTNIFTICQKLFNNLKKVCYCSFLNVNLTDYTENPKTEIMNAIYKWYQGENFNEENPPQFFFEGCIEKCIKKAQEISKRIFRVCELIGDVSLALKFETCFYKIKSKTNIFKSIKF